MAAAKMKNLLLTVALLSTSGCSDLMQSSQRTSITRMKADLQPVVVAAQDAMLSAGQSGALIPYIPGQTTPLILLGASPLTITLENYGIISALPSNAACIFLPSYSIPAPPSITPCSSLSADGRVHVGIMSTLSNHAKSIEDLNAVSEKTAEAALEAFRLGAANSTLIISQGDLITGVSSDIDTVASKITGVETKVDGFKSSVTAQLGSLITSLNALTARLDAL